MLPISDYFSLDYLLQTPDLISTRDSVLAGVERDVLSSSHFPVEMVTIHA